MTTTELTPNLTVGAQLEADDLQPLKAQGFTDIVCNRPDEEHPDGPVSAVMHRVATELGLRFHYLPIVPGEAMAEQAENLARIVARPGARVFAYCRTGARSTGAWQLAEAAGQAS